MNLALDLKFCTECSSLRDFSQISGDVLPCLVCGAKVNMQQLVGYTIATTVTYKTLSEEDNKDETANNDDLAMVDEACEKCGHRGLRFFTMQLRSADEGQTVFHECPKCNHKTATNT